jgi:putative acetyltransferase
MIRIRELHPDDAPLLLELFRETVRRVNARDYSAEQVLAWSSDEIDPAAWSARFAGRYVAVAEAEGQVVGFAELEGDGHIDRFYVSAHHQRLGVGRALLAAIEEEARRLGIGRLVAEVSITGRPFFESQGFTVVSPQVVTLRGVDFRNYHMARQLA